MLGVPYYSHGHSIKYPKTLFLTRKGPYIMVVRIFRPGA